jgi:hypothetical protein
MVEMCLLPNRLDPNFSFLLCFVSLIFPTTHSFNSQNPLFQCSIIPTFQLGRSPLRGSAGNAAFLNGVMARSLDFYDAMSPGLHIGSSAVPSCHGRFRDCMDVAPVPIQREEAEKIISMVARLEEF